MKTHPTLTHPQITLAILFTLLFLSLSSPLSSQLELLDQSGPVQSSLNRPTAVADDGLGNSFMAGNFRDTLILGSFILSSLPLDPVENYGANTGFIGKYNSNSDSWVWVNQLVLLTYSTGSGESLSTSSLNAIARDNSGNTYITGNYYGKIKLGGITLTSLKQGAYPTTDIFVAKLNSSGTFLWAKSLGSKDGTDIAYAIALDGGNNILVGGTYARRNSACYWGETTYDAYTAKLNNAGAIQWEKRFARNPMVCNLNQYVSDLAVDASGNVVITGVYSGTVSFGNGGALTISSVSGSQDVFVAKLNSSGSTQWVRSAGGVSREQVAAVRLDASGNSYIGGDYGGGTPAGGDITFGSITLANTDGSSDPFVAQYSASGSVIWAVNPIPNSAPFASVGIRQITPYDGALLINDTRIGFQTISMTDGSTLSTIPILINGVNESDPGLTGYFIISDVDVAGSGYIFAMRGLCGTVTIDGTSFSSSCTGCTGGCTGYGDLFLVRSGSGAFLAEEPFAENLDIAIRDEGFEIYPNPANNDVVIQRKSTLMNQTITIYDQLGRAVHIEHLFKGQNIARISTENMIEGTYFISSITDGMIHTRKLIVQH